MKPRRLAELRALIAQPEFQEWWSQLTRGREELEANRARYDELLSQAHLMEFRAELTQKNAIDTLYRAGECEDSAASLVAQSTELENRSFRVVADFEEQRYKVSEIWYRLGAAEKGLEDLREQKAPEPTLKQAETVLRAAAHEYEAETAKKDRLWEEVERLWAKSAEVSLLVAEQRMQGKKVRKQAESLFALAEERKQRAKALKIEAEAASAEVEAAEVRIQSLRDRAREQFGCTAGTDFLYFRHKDNPKLAFGVPLLEDKETFNIEVSALSVYTVDRAKGVLFLEPARTEAASQEDGDRRFEEFFLNGRKGAAQSSRS